MSKRVSTAKYVLPIDVNPPTKICFQIEVPNDIYHIGAFMGQIFQLARWWSWAEDPAHTAKVVADIWLDIFNNIKRCPPPPSIGGADEGVEQLIRQNPDNPCQLQTSIDGQTWCTFADFSLCLPAAPQAGDGTPQPPSGGGQTCYRLTFAANSKALLPAPVNAGDTLTLQSATGAGNDGTISPWQCPDGSTFFGGICISGTGGTSGGDPLNTSKHMCLLYKIAGVYYDATLGPFSVPGGIVNEQVEIQVNDSAISDNAGSYQIEVCATNNQAASWSHTFDFLVSDGGWVLNNGTLVDTWAAGIGWQDATVFADRGIQLKRALASRTVTGITLYFNMSSPAGTATWDCEIAAPAFVLFNSGTPSAGANIKGGNGSAAATELVISVFSSVGSGNVGSSTLTKIVVTGEGTDPF